MAEAAVCARRGLTCEGGLEQQRRARATLTMMEREKGTKESLGCIGGRSEAGSCLSVVERERGTNEKKNE